ncbi:hypothetical protein A7X12_08420 [Sphingomonas sp. TDK1]|nr:hypothetical protein A7X12_08420 [Sphingomonas sp. TDK1]
MCMAIQLDFDFDPTAALAASKAARARAAMAKYRAHLSDDYITGRETDVLKLLRRGPTYEPKRQLDPETPHPSRSGLPPAQFHIPRPPRGRPTTRDGRQSFHFALTNVTKGVDGKCRTNDGKDADPVFHVGYVAREEAVATDLVPTVHEAVAHVGYIARDEAVALDPDGTAIILANVEDPTTFFAKILEHENSGHLDGICLSQSYDEAALRTLLGVPTIPPALKTGIIRILEDPEAHRVPKTSSEKSKTHPFQIDDDISSCRSWLKKHDADGQVYLRRGRGGIVQRRITGELPAELDRGQCRRVLQRLVRELERRGLRYFVALHAPSAANDNRNWHFHLLYYERPCDKIGDQWDFEIVQKVRSSTRNIRDTYPYRQNKDRGVGHKTWPMEMRKCFAAAVNIELEAIGSVRRYDPRSYAEMHLCAEPQEHLGRSVGFIADCGAAPSKDRENARKGWSARQFQMIQRFAEVEKADEERFRGLRANLGDTPQAREKLTELERAQAEARAAAWTGKVLLDIFHAMACSNAEQTGRKMKGRAVEQAEKCRARGKDPAANRMFQAYEQRVREANTYLADLEEAFAPEVELAKSLIRDAEVAFKRIDAELVAVQNAATQVQPDRGLAPRPVLVPPTPAALIPYEKPATVSPEPARRSPPPLAAPANSSKPATARGLEEVSRWLAEVESKRRRLKLRDGRVEPLDITPRDVEMLDIASLQQQKELSRLRDRQNHLIARIVKAVEAAPGILTIPAEANGKWTLAHRDGDLQDGLKRYIVDPDVQNRLRAAQEKGLAEQAANRGVAPQVHRAIDEISRAAIAIHQGENGFTIRETDANRLGIERESLEGAAAQRRLEAIRRSQEGRVAQPAAQQTIHTPAEENSQARALVVPVPIPSASVPVEPAVRPATPTPVQPAAEAPMDRVPAVPPAAEHPLVEQWLEAHRAQAKAGNSIPIGERNRRAAVALKDPHAAEELRRLGSELWAAVEEQAAANRRFQKRAARQFSQRPTIT